MQINQTPNICEKFTKAQEIEKKSLPDWFQKVHG